MYGNNLLEFYNGYSLTSDQVEAVSRLEKFFSSSEKCFILKGYAGTGKTFLLNGLVGYLDSMGIPVHVMAPTGKAAKVVSIKIKKPAYTIHKTIYAIDELRELTEMDDKTSESYRFRFGLKKYNDDNTRCVYIVDEASMISNVYNDNDFFIYGSGYLLNDLAAFLNLSINNQRKIIFVGDRAQLPPVESKFSPALDTEEIRKVFGFTVSEFELRQVVRQEEGSLILHHASRIRKSIMEGIYNSFEIETDSENIIRIGSTEVAAKYLEGLIGLDINSSIIIAQTNKLVKQYNIAVRKLLFPGREDIVPGDKLLIVQNNYKNTVELFNGDICTVIEVSPNMESRKVILKSKTGRIECILNFRDIVIEVINQNNEKIRVGCKIFDNLLNTGDPRPTEDELKAIYIDFKMRHKSLHPGSIEFIQAIKDDPYFNCIKAKYGYALTCHKAQGGEWDKVFIDFRSVTEKLSEGYFRWAYTALTRGKKRLYLIDHAPITITGSLTNKCVLVEDSSATCASLPPLLKDELDGMSFPADKPFLKEIYLIAKRLISACSSEIISIQHLQYCEKYHITCERGIFYILVYYNKEQIVSNITCQGDTTKEISAPVLKALGVLLKKRFLNCDNLFNEANTLSFPEEKPFLKQFFDAVCELLKDTGIEVKSVRHHAYMEKYHFSRCADEVWIAFYYKATGKFMNYTLQGGKNNSKDLFQIISNLLKGVKI